MKLFEKIVEMMGFMAIMAVVQFLIGLFKASKKADTVIEKEMGFSVSKWLKDELINDDLKN